MTAYIPKERLGDNAHRLKMQRRQQVDRTVRASRGFKLKEVAWKRGVEKKQESLKELWDSNAENQRWDTLTSEEKARQAIERLVPTVKEVERLKGNDISYEEARKKAEGIAYRHDADKG